MAPTDEDQAPGIPEGPVPPIVVFRVDGHLKAALWWDLIRLLMAFMLGALVGVGVGVAVASGVA